MEILTTLCQGQVCCAAPRPVQHCISHWTAEVLRFHGICYMKNEGVKGGFIMRALLCAEEEGWLGEVKVKAVEAVAVAKFFMKKAGKLLIKAKGSISTEVGVFISLVPGGISWNLKARCWVPGTIAQSNADYHMTKEMLGLGDIDDDDEDN